MMRIVLALALTLAAPEAFAAPTKCAPRSDVREQLGAKWGEERVARGLQKVRGKTLLMEIYASRETGTFTVTLTGPDGVSCLVAAGTNYFQEPETPEGDPT